jgi:sorbitol/mannitol transport system substrate-binding protein
MNAVKMRMACRIESQAVLALLLAMPLAAQTITVATVNNADMVTMRDLSHVFEEKNPGIHLNWILLEENVLRERTTVDVALHGRQFDVITIGDYETPLYAAKGWLSELKPPPSYDVDDLVKPVRDVLTYNKKLYAAPFYAESSMTYYRKDLLEKRGLTMPAKPTWEDIRRIAAAIDDKSSETFGVCLRGKAGWGENMALIDTMVNTYNGTWFDMQWHPTIDTPEWRQAIGMYTSLLLKYGPPNASSNGFNENLALFASGKCGIWVDATVAAGAIYDPAQSKVADKVAIAPAPIGVSPAGQNWLWVWSLAIPTTSKYQDAAQKFVAWATSKEYITLVGKQKGWKQVPPGTRESTYANPQYSRVAPFASAVKQAIDSTDSAHPTSRPVPYTGIGYVDIPEFQGIGTQSGQFFTGVLAGNLTMERALQLSQKVTDRAVKQAGYEKN